MIETKPYELTQKEHSDLKIGMGISKWINRTILVVLVAIFAGLATVVNQNHNLKIDFVVMNKTLSDHLLEQKDLNASVAKFLVGHEEDEEKRRKKDYYVRGGDG